VHAAVNTNVSASATIYSSGYCLVLDDDVNTINGHAVNRAASRRIGSGETIRPQAFRNALPVKCMRPIANVAAAGLKQVPEITALEVPPVGGTSSSRDRGLTLQEPNCDPRPHQQPGDEHIEDHWDDKHEIPGDEQQMKNVHCVRVSAEDLLVVRDHEHDNDQGCRLLPVL
jgi:hypothetical protein